MTSLLTSFQQLSNKSFQIESKVDELTKKLELLEKNVVQKRLEMKEIETQESTTQGSTTQESTTQGSSQGSEEECPVKIHRVTEDTDGKSKSSGKCPISSQKKPEEEKKEVESKEEEKEPRDVTTFEEEDYDVNPNMQEYKKIKRVMGMITQFYSNGTNLKRANYEEITSQIEKLNEDLVMVQEQLKSLDVPSFRTHPKLKEYEAALKSELDGLLKMKEDFLAKQKSLYDLSEWSKTIVQVCKWLELNLDEHCAKTLNLNIKTKPVPVLSEEEKKIYSRGLGEITYNLQESQDFFEASLDGRLNKYHSIEQNIILSQLEALKRFPEDSPRRQHIEAELLKDLEYVKGHMEVTPQSIARREKMLKNHREFFKVLAFHKDKLKALGVDDSNEKKYDPKYNHYQD